MADIVSREEEQFRTWMETKNASSLFALLYGQEAVRMSALVNDAVNNGYVGFWLAIRLSDGGSDEIAYAKKADAIKHQLHEQQCCYVKLPPDGMGPKHAAAYLDVHRKLYSAGMRIVDPDDPRRGVIIPR
jgi:hypothetical protein